MIRHSTVYVSIIFFGFVYFIDSFIQYYNLNKVGISLYPESDWLFADRDASNLGKVRSPYNFFLSGCCCCIGEGYAQQKRTHFHET